MAARGDSWRGSRRRLLGAAGTAGLWLVTGGRAGAASASGLLGNLHIANGGKPFAGDRRLLTTIGGRRGGARITFTLTRPARVSLQILETGQGAASEQPSQGAEATLKSTTKMFLPGRHTVEWEPPAGLAPRTYIARVVAETADGTKSTAQAVARVLGIDASFAVRSVVPGQSATLVARADANSLTVQMLRSGPESEPTYANDEIKGVPMGGPLPAVWSTHANAPAPLTVPTGADWSSGVYAAQITADDGRVGYAPLILRPAQPRARVAVVMPTSTWAAYNFYDEDGDGWGDTWYAHWRTMHADLTRPQPNRGVPYRYRSYDLAFQRWLAQTGKVVDTYADEDLELFPTAKALRAAYDLIVFPGHTEYVTERVYDLIESYRDLGGNLMFLAANNFFRKIERANHRITLIDEWRNLRRAESALLGVQYIASDRGQRHAPFTVVGADVAPWAFEGTGLQNGSTFGTYGIEIDARSAASPPSTQVLATIPDLFGPGRSAEMTYYEHWSGARVFSAGVLNFGGQALLWPVATQILANVWNRLAPGS